MKIAITADCHLSSKHPQRRQSLEWILKQIEKQKINILFVAGDLFDKEQQNYSELDDIAKKFSGIKIYVIPGNHDSNIIAQHFTAENVVVVSGKPKVISIDGVEFLFVPYVEGKTMDELIVEAMSEVVTHTKKVVLVSHGDYLTSSWEVNPYEKKMYMPLTWSVVDKYKFLKVFLGHNHKPTETGKVCYPGSPYPIDINETGKRRFVIFDTTTYETTSNYIDTPVINFVETILISPIENEFETVKNLLNDVINSWQLSEEEIKKVTLRLKVRGYTTDKKGLKDVIENYLTGRGIKIDDIDLSELNIPDKDETYNEKIQLFHQVKEKLQGVELDDIRDGLVDKKDIEEKILGLIFGVKE